MKRILNIALKVILSMLLLMPIGGALGLFPEPTADMYTSETSFAFIQALTNSGYIMPLMALVFGIAFVLVWTKRMPLAALIILPITVNIVAFHAVLDGGLFTAGAIMGNVLLLLNAYFLWQSRKSYASLVKKSS